MSKIIIVEEGSMLAKSVDDYLRNTGNTSPNKIDTKPPINHCEYCEDGLEFKCNNKQKARIDKIEGVMKIFKGKKLYKGIPIDKCPFCEKPFKNLIDGS